MKMITEIVGMTAVALVIIMGVKTVSNGATEHAPRFEGWPITSEDHPITEVSDEMEETLSIADGAPDPEWRARLRDAGVNPNSADEVASYREQLQRRVESSIQARWAVLQEEGRTYSNVQALRVVDGDTLDVRLDVHGDGHAEVERLRLYKIDTIEAHDPGGEKATAALKRMAGERVTIWVPTEESEYGTRIERGKFGRPLAILYPPETETTTEGLYAVRSFNEQLAKEHGK